MALPKSTETKKVNLDFNKEFINTFTQNIERGNVEFINQTLKDLHEADVANLIENLTSCLLYTSPSPRDLSTSRMPSSA